MPKVGILMGSTSDLEVMKNCEDYLKWFGIEFETHVISAHRNPEKCSGFAKNAKENGFSILIGAAGMAAHLPGVLASLTTLPVIGVPLAGSELSGVDALYSIVQMPAGIPVATVAIGKAGAKNAAILAAQILALNNNSIAEKLLEFKNNGCKI
ncbi:5-(carboxyamino)imidazole ribonucleotide mutase [bacterium]|nr:5-(carboxyamino)imidazole ribonucleotide mutase [bacterium]